MPATLTDLTRLTRDSITVFATSSAVQTRHGASARDNSDNPIVTFFDAESDAQTMADARLSILTNPSGGDRKLLELTVDGIKPMTGLLACNLVTPSVYVTDANVTGTFFVQTVSYDFASMQTVFTLFG